MQILRLCESNVIMLVMCNGKRALLLHLLLLAGEQGVDGCVELVAALEEVELEHEDVAGDGGAELLHERAGCGCRAACNLD
jgi:hypothetical protein